MKPPIVALGFALLSCSASQPDAPNRQSPKRTAEPVELAPVEARGREYRTHEPSPPDEATEHRKDCEGGGAQACHAAALDQYYSPPGPQTDRLAFEYFDRACKAGYAPSCNGLGVLYATGRGVQQDEAEAARIYRKACIDGASTACTHLEQALRYGRGVAKDPEAAEAAKQRGNCVFDASLGRGKLEACPPLSEADGGAG
jgi:TPR repeat protein